MSTEIEPIDLDPSQRFEALKMRYEDHVELLRYMTGLDLKLFSGVMTIQVALGSWLATKPIESTTTVIVLLALDGIIAGFGAVLLRNNALRRKEAVETLKNINLAFGFTTRGFYLADRAINATGKFRLWGPWYMAGIVIAFIGLVVVVTTAKMKSEPNGAANGSQPIRLQTNSTPSAAGSRR
jgi:hypothetical protein